MVGSTDESVGRVGSVGSVAVGSAVGKAARRCSAFTLLLYLGTRKSAKISLFIS